MDVPSESYLYVFDLIGVAVFAVSGALAAGRRRVDLLGVLVAAAVTAIGGGTIRDLLLDRHPIFWLGDARYLLTIGGAAALTVLYVRWRRAPGVAHEVADALGLALFTVTGAQVAERAGMPAISSVLLGAMTGAAGGVMRDVLLAQLPHVLQRRSLYVTAAIAGASVYIALERVGIERPVPSLAGMLCAAALRIAAIWWELKLPEFAVRTEGPSDAP